jgi:hypothetical protein
MTCQVQLQIGNLFLIHADVAKLVDALDLGSSAARHGGSSPSIRTLIRPSITVPIKLGSRLGFFCSNNLNPYDFGN